MTRRHDPQIAPDPTANRTAHSEHYSTGLARSTPASLIDTGSYCLALGIGLRARSAADLLANPSTWINRALAAAFRRVRLRLRAVWPWLSGFLGPAARRLAAPESSEPHVVHDHFRLRQHQIAAAACVDVRIRSRQVHRAGTIGGGEAVGGSPSGRELSGPGAAEMISDSCTDRPQWPGFDQERRRAPAANDPKCGLGGRALRYRLQTRETVISTCSATALQALATNSKIC